MVEVEVKIRLPSEREFETVRQHFQTNGSLPTKIHHQENQFFDGPNAELSSVRAVFRLRFTEEGRKCVATLKEKSTVSASTGVAVAQEKEHEVDAAVGRRVVEDPTAFSELQGDVPSELPETAKAHRG
eukprot:TRINITY_DN413_c0_g1_i1.p1 TRINITY_DN413_c0_g1~~TRINITY_DN413_c0_g1_i1.p1  ORF type:complete len:128 (+),score=0.91 TRINITY_DN413_c0_g1_i1:79-462(+)